MSVCERQRQTYDPAKKDSETLPTAGWGLLPDYQAVQDHITLVHYSHDVDWHTKPQTDKPQSLESVYEEPAERSGSDNFEKFLCPGQKSESVHLGTPPPWLQKFLLDQTMNIATSNHQTHKPSVHGDVHTIETNQRGGRGS